MFPSDFVKYKANYCTFNILKWLEIQVRAKVRNQISGHMPYTFYFSYIMHQAVSMTT